MPDASYSYKARGEISGAGSHPSGNYQSAPTLKSIYVFLFSLLFIPKVYAISPSPVQAIKTPPRANSANLEPNAIKSYVIQESEAYGVPVDRAVFIVEHESQWNPKKLGDDGNSRGLWQISSIWHSEVSNQCAMDYQCSTRWSLAWIAAGHINQWSSYRLCKKLYNECPQ